MSLEDPREVLTVGFVVVSVEGLVEALKAVAGQEQVRHDRIESVIESTTLKAIYDLETEHDFTNDPRVVEIGSAHSLLIGLAQAGDARV